MSNRLPLSTLFRLTLASGVPAAVSLHLRRGAPINGRDARGRSPLIIAASRGHAEVCQLLIKAGADCFLLDDAGLDAASTAKMAKHPGTAALIGTLSIAADLPKNMSVPRKDQGAEVEGLHDQGKSIDVPRVSGFATAGDPSSSQSLTKETELTTDLGNKSLINKFSEAVSSDNALSRPSLTNESLEGSSDYYENHERLHFIEASSSQETKPPGSTSWNVEKEGYPALPIVSLSSTTQVTEADSCDSISILLSNTHKQVHFSIFDMDHGQPFVTSALSGPPILEEVGSLGWEPEEDPATLPPLGSAIQVAATAFDITLSAHRPVNVDADWLDVEVILPDPMPLWARDLVDGLNAPAAVNRLLDAGIENGWLAPEELDAELPWISGRKENQLRRRLETVLDGMGIIVEARHCLDLSRFDNSQVLISERPWLVATRAEGTYFLNYALDEERDAENLLNDDVSGTRILTASEEIVLFQRLAVSRESLTRSIASHPATYRLLREWASELEAGSLQPKELSHADWSGEGASATSTRDVVGPDNPSDKEIAYIQTEADSWTEQTGASRRLASMLRQVIISRKEQGQRIKWSIRLAEQAIFGLALTDLRMIKIAEYILAQEGERNYKAVQPLAKKPRNFTLLNIKALGRRKIMSDETGELHKSKGQQLVSSLVTALEIYETTRAEIVKSNLRRVVWHARRYSRASVPFLDLVQEGQLGLLKAVERYDMARGWRFGTYAQWWIRQSIQRAIQDQGRVIRVPVHLAERLGRSRRVAAKLHNLLGREPDAAELSAATGEPVHITRTFIELDLEPVPISLHEGHSKHEWSDVEDNDLVIGLHSGEEDPLTNMLRHDLRRCLAQGMQRLDPRARRILDLRFGLSDGNELTLEEVGQVYGVTRERIRQIEAKSLKQLLRALPDRKFKNMVP